MRAGSYIPRTLLALAGLCLWPDRAECDPRERHAELASASMGFANRGTLSHGRRLMEGPSVRFLPGRSLHYGTEELVGLIERVARSLQRRFHLRLTVGDLSARNGGPVGHHASHQSGRDADILFFVRDSLGAAVLLSDMVIFDANGVSADGRLRFDTARNWALVEAMLTDRAVTVERLFISNPLRLRLIAYGRAHGASSALIRRAQLTLMQPTQAAAHDNHFHVRISCPAGDPQCQAGVHLTRTLRTAQRQRTLRHALQRARPRRRR